MMKTTVLFVVLFTFAFSSVNSSISCSSNGVSLRCTIRTTNSTLIQETFASYMGKGDTLFSIVVEEAGKGVVLNLTFNQSKTSLDIWNRAVGDISVETHTVDNAIISIVLEGHNFIVPQENFFSFFPNLEKIEAFPLE